MIPAVLESGPDLLYPLTQGRAFVIKEDIGTYLILRNRCPQCGLHGVDIGWFGRPTKISSLCSSPFR